MDFTQIMTFLPAILAVVTPPIVQGIKKLVAKFSGKMPKWLIPIVAAVVGAIGEGIMTGTVSGVGPMAGLAGTGVRDVVKNARSTG